MNCGRFSCCKRVRNMLSLNLFIFSVVAANFVLIEAVLDFVDEDYFGRWADRYNWTKHPCNRDCWRSTRRRTCYYVFVVEQFSTMSKACHDCPYKISDCYKPHCIPVDGVQKMVYTVNRHIPGPTIEVCTNDLIVIDVRNKMLAESTSIHWHGLKQERTPFMDGVPHVSQCPIQAGETFRYTFKASSSGTFFWHSHIGSQRTDGLYGALVVHPSLGEDTHKNLYDHDRYHMMISDWIHFDANSGLVKEYYDRPGNNPDTIIVNGKGRLRRFKRGNMIKYTPIEVYTVSRMWRYRFRLINAGADDCPIRLSIDKHSLLVISLDSKDIVPVTVDAIDTWPGERVDFVLTANQNPDNYWIRLKGFGLCSPQNKKSGVYGLARLRYRVAPNQEPKAAFGYNIPNPERRLRVLNPFGRGTEIRSVTNVQVPLLTAIDPDDVSLRERPDHQIYISFDFYPLDNQDFQRKRIYGFNQVKKERAMGTMQLNHITLKLPPFPLLSQWYMIDESTFCNSSTISRSECRQEHCVCTHVLHVKYKSVVELVFVDEGRYVVANHPLHLHGHFFRVIASEKLSGVVTVDRVKQLDRSGRIRRRLKKAPIKDTIKAPGGGYTIVRFHANNPGYWFFHCHFEQHANIGMALVVKVGEHRDFPPIPDNFPMCHNYEPAM